MKITWFLLIAQLHKKKSNFNIYFYLVQWSKENCFVIYLMVTIRGWVCYKITPVNPRYSKEERFKSGFIYIQKFKDKTIFKKVWNI